MLDVGNRRLSRPLLLGLWSLLVGGLLLVGGFSQYLTTLERGRSEVRAYYNVIKNFRHWAAEHGGVYVPLTDETPANPYLEHIPERDITTPSGKRLTLMNPAYATRQIHDVLERTSNVKGHLTSLKPIREKNSPDAWETEALKAFETGVKEVSDLSDVSGKSFLRLMRPLTVQESCLQCHKKQGYQTGQIRGGLSISVPMAPHYTVMTGNLIRLGLGFGILWLIGGMMIVLGYRSIERGQRERDEAHRLLQVSEKRFRNLAEAAPVGIFQANSRTRISFANKSLETTLGVAEGKARGLNLFEFLHPDGKDQILEKWQKVASDGGIFNEEFCLRLADDRDIWTVGIIISENRKGNTEISGNKRYIGTLIDVSQHKEAERKIHQLAFTDPYTGMPNEAFFLEALNRSVSENRNGFVAFIELSGIGDLVGTFGLEAFELVIFQTGMRLSNQMNDQSVVCRTGERLFKVLYITDDKSEILDPHSITQRLYQTASDSFDLMGSSVFVNVFMGVAIINPNESTSETILTEVEISHYEASRPESGSIVYFDDAIKSQLVRNTQLVAHLNSAIKHQDFQLYFQPQINLKDNAVIGCEALIRWQLNPHEWVCPGEFIPIAEKSGQIGDLTTWTIAEACRLAAVWRNEHGKDIRISVNISAEELTSPGFFNRAARIIEETKVSPHLLEIEITETALMKDTVIASINLRKLRELGATVSIDDFGTGQSSLAYLKSFPIDRLKIDQSFVKNAPWDKADQEIIVSIIKLAHSLGMQVIAEGAEEKEHIQLLESLGCDEVQGYYYAKAMPEDDFLQFVADHDGDLKYSHL